MARSKQKVDASAAAPRKTLTGPKKPSVAASRGEVKAEVRAKKADSAEKPKTVVEAVAATATATRKPKVVEVVETDVAAKTKRPYKHRPGYHPGRVMRKQQRSIKTVLKTEPTNVLVRATLREMQDVAKAAYFSGKSFENIGGVNVNEQAMTTIRYFLDSALHQLACKARLSMQTHNRMTQFPSDVIMGMRMCGWPEHLVHEVVRMASEELEAAA